VTDQLLWFDSEIDVDPTLRRTVVEIHTSVTTVSEELAIIREDARPRSYVSQNDEHWDWEALRDYVVEQIEKRHGMFPREGAKEKAIFARFIKDWGPRAAPIARYAFEVRGGIWKGAPIKVTRFTKACDPYFAAEIDTYLQANQP
jgi:hypothetical protein